MHTIKVEYEWKPSRCETCLVFGHDDAQCPKRVIVDLMNLGNQRGTQNDGFQTVQMKGEKEVELYSDVYSFSALERGYWDNRMTWLMVNIRRWGMSHEDWYFEIRLERGIFFTNQILRGSDDVPNEVRRLVL
ncbi:zinc knuckle CX2CX4HX4C containing protein [Tanacetum coccineum]